MAKKHKPVPDRGDETWGAVMTKPGLVLGTVSYMSPEQARGSEVDERTDVWSLGVVLYELITGKPPFVGVSPADVAAAIIEVEPDPIDSESTDAPKRLSQIVMRALAKEVDGRYRSIAEMLDDLKNVRNEIRSNEPAPRSVAILPFVNITGDPRVSFFEFALADAVTTELANTGYLMVRPSSAVAKYVGRKVDPIAIGNELNVDAILAANFLVTETRIRVTAQLIDVPNKKVLWGEQIDSEGNDILALQDTITHHIVEGLQCELETTDECILLPATSNSMAYVEYLRGRDQLRRYMFHTVANENVEIAMQHFTRAIDLDPNFALAHSALATCYLQRVLKIFGSRQDLENAAKEFDRALELEPRLTDARAYRAFIMRLQGEAQRSRDEMAKLRRDSPNYFEVQYLSAACYRFDGDYERAFACYEEMLRIDPTAQVSVHYCRARIFWYRGRYDLSFDELSKARSIEPNHPIVRFFHAIVTFRSGEPAIAVEQIKRIFATYPCEGFRPYLAICLSALGDFDAARRELTEESEKIAEVDPDVAYWVATAHLMAGRKDEALKWLEQSIFLGNHNRSAFETDKIWMPMHGDSRYDRLLSGLKYSYN
jgi:serine/threonine-protein kinase